MGMPITTTAGGVCFAFPDVCNTPVGAIMVTVPYPNIGQLSDAINVSTTVKVKGNFVVLQESEIPLTSGDEAGSGGGVTSGTIKGKVKFTSYSSKVKINRKFPVRMTDTTTQNKGNANGVVLGGEPTVLCG